ncbi:MAG: hypothetical protein H0V56_10400, partial [Chthoniobacterales bacterium]|nr:hypothetical protein [Chthoniobacterales bacterium]
MRILAYRGYATRTHLFVSGRVLGNNPPAARHDSDSLWQRLLGTYRRFRTDELPNVPVTVRFENEEQTFRTDADGYYHAELPRLEGRALSRPDEAWLTAEAHCEIRGRHVSATHQIVAPT